MSSAIKINGHSTAQPVGAALEENSREKMISLVVEARLFQTKENGLQTKGLLPLPFQEKDKAHAREVRTKLGELLGVKGALPMGARRLVCSYFTDEELGALSIYVNMPRHVDLTDANVLKGYLDPSINEYVESCRQIVKAVYESTSREISQNKYGSAFPINPELLSYAMQLARNETVLEIAGATGENSAALAFSEAQRVYLNDIGAVEVQLFERIRKGLTSAIPSVGQKLEGVHADCFDLLKLKPELAKKVGLVLCRNLIHFFNNKKQEEFFALLKKILKPGGHAIFLVNSVYYETAQKEVSEKRPDATSFETTQCFLSDYTKGTKPVGLFYRQISTCSGDKVSVDFISRQIYTRELGSSWQKNEEEFNQLDEELKPVTLKAYEMNKSAVSQIPAGHIKVLTNWVRAYNTETLPALFVNQGFQVIQTFVTSFNGHLVHGDPSALCDNEQINHQEQPQLMGVLVRYPGS